METGGEYFGSVDSAYLNLLAEVLERDKQATYESMRIEGGQQVLDVGCGTGTDTVALAQLVGPGGRVKGVDNDLEMIAEADRRSIAVGVGDRVSHELAEATALPFGANTFHSSRSERLFQHLADPAAALAEMVRVTKPEGWIVVLDTDHGTASVDFPDSDLERRLMRLRSDLAHNGYSGRQLYRLFKEQSFSEAHFELRPIYITSYAVAREAVLLARVEREALARRVATTEEIHRWQETLRKADEEGVFFFSTNLTLAVGRKR